MFNLRLNADLVVLSACNTASGKLSKGEGLIGISRAFLYAGAPSLLVSLWNVEDEATSTIMDSFYRYLQKGEGKNNALRMAKLDYLRSVSPEKRDPFFWAPFVLFGDSNPLSLGMKQDDFGKPLVGLVIVMLASTVLILVLKKWRNGKRWKE